MPIQTWWTASWHSKKVALQFPSTWQILSWLVAGKSTEGLDEGCKCQLSVKILSICQLSVGPLGCILAGYCGLTRISRSRFKQSKISRLISHIYFRLFCKRLGNFWVYLAEDK